MKLAIATVSTLLLLVVASPAPALTDLTEQETWTLTAMARLTEAIDTYARARGTLPAVGTTLERVEFLRDELEPEFIDSMPLEDGWRSPLLYWSNGTAYALVSRGADGEAGGDYLVLPAVPESGDDFVWVNGRHKRSPAHIMQAMEVGLQRRSMADMRSIAVCFEAYRVDNDALPGGATDGWVPVETIREVLEPVYIRTLPLNDAWGNPFEIWSDGMRYRIVSAGRDGVREADYSVLDGTRGTTSFDSDIVMADGEFRQWPDGPQH